MMKSLTIMIVVTAVSMVDAGAHKELESIEHDAPLAGPARTCSYRFPPNLKLP
jgi:hypothetical protein